MSPETQTPEDSPYFRGIYTARDFIRPNEFDAHAQLVDRLMDELSPETVLEEIHFGEAVTAAWRLNRLAQIEAGMSYSDVENQLDPMADPEPSKLQLSVDRARRQYNNLFRRAVAEIRSLQKERSSRPDRPAAPSAVVEQKTAEQKAAEKKAAEQKTEQTQSARAAHPIPSDLDPLSPENMRKSFEAIENDAEYQAMLVEAYYRGLARRAESAAETQHQS
jgi:hypothetical protein